MKAQQSVTGVGSVVAVIDGRRVGVRTRRRWAGAVVAVTGAVALGALPAAAAGIPLRFARPQLSGVASGSVLTTVPPSLSSYPLSASAFTVTSRGQRVPVEVARVVDAGADVVLLMDTGSGAEALQAEVSGAVDLVRALPASANVTVATTHDPAHPSAGGDAAALQFLATLQPAAGSVGEALRAVAGAPAARPRRIVLLAGCPTTVTDPQAADVASRLSRADQQLDVVGYGELCSPPLRRLAQDTGGIAVSAKVPAEFVGLTDTALASVQGQYRLSFTQRATTSTTISVTVAANEVEATGTFVLPGAAPTKVAPSKSTSTATFVDALRFFIVALAVLLLLLVATGLVIVLSGHRLRRLWPPMWAAARRNQLEIGLVAGVVAVASFLRFWNLGRIGFRGDEAVYAGQAAIMAGDRSMERYFILASRGNSNFLLYQEILAVVYRLFGVSDVAARLVSAFFSVVTVVAVYLLGRQLYGRRAALFGAGALALSGYAVGLGRLALLDSTATFFVVLAVLFLALWLQAPRDRWLCGFAASTMLAAQAKVAGILLMAVFVCALTIEGAWRHLERRSVLRATLTSLVALVPAGIQVAVRPATIYDFLGSSLQRRSAVPWYYYGNALLHAEGAAILVALVLGLGLAAARPRRADVLLWIWLGVFGLFFWVYPLKAFNYLLPLVPALALLAGRGLATLRMPRLPRLALPVAIAVLASLCAAPALASAVGTARWIAANAPRNAGVMTLSQGSGQYVYSFYADRDAYPFGRFRLTTVLPGGAVYTPRQTPAGKLPLDWVTDQPEKLIRKGTVSYLVYATGSLDDPPEQSQILGTQTQRQFRSLIESFGGRLVHQVTYHHEVRAYVYVLTKRQQRPTVTYTVAEGKVRLHGVGFAEGSTVTVTYNRATLGTTRSDPSGEVAVTVPMPRRTQRPYHIVLSDATGNYASARGLPAPLVRYVATGRQLVIDGQDFSAGAPVTIAYHERTLTRVNATSKGSVTARVSLPADSKPRYQLRLTDAYGLTAWTTVSAPSIRFTVSSGTVRVTGQHFLPSTAVSLTYHGRIVARPRSNAIGSFGVSFALPSNSKRSYQLIASDEQGGRAIAVDLVGTG